VARKSNLVPTVKKYIFSHHCLWKSDVEDCGDHLIVHMRWSKTNQFWERVIRTPLPCLPGSVLCPVSAYINFIKFHKGSGDDVLFLLSSKRPVTYYLF